MLHAQKQPAGDGFAGSKHVEEIDDQVTVHHDKLL
jgi:hypothetical protein